MSLLARVVNTGLRQLIAVKNSLPLNSTCSLLPTRTCLATNIKERNIHTSPSTREIFTVQDDQDFQDKVIKNKKPVVVDFHAKWCGPCKMLMPRLERGLSNVAEQVDMAKIDIDDLPDIAMDFGVGAVPSVLLIKDGAVVDKFVGLKDDDQIDAFLVKAAAISPVSKPF